MPGATFFFTVVTNGRQPLFASPVARRLLGRAWRSMAVERCFDTVAAVLLHDHIHCVWKLPAGDSDFSERWREIKSRFTKSWLDSGGDVAETPDARRRRREPGVWQSRFWEHLIRDESDLEIHVDYIHYNPVKHGYASRPRDWPYSSFLKHVQRGQYDLDRGRDEPSVLQGLNWK